jgi:hypothetical protein
MMEKIRIFAKLNLIKLSVQQTALDRVKKFVQPRQLFSIVGMTTFLEYCPKVAMAVVGVCQFVRVI